MKYDFMLMCDSGNCSNILNYTDFIICMHDADYGRIRANCCFKLAQVN